MRLAKFVKFREEQFGGVLFETRSEKVYTLNPTAAAIVREISAGGDVAGIGERLRGRFAAPDGILEQDVLALVEDLQRKGLLADEPA
jgi:hypothetical protein